MIASNDRRSYRCRLCHEVTRGQMLVAMVGELRLAVKDSPPGQIQTNPVGYAVLNGDH